MKRKRRDTDRSDRAPCKELLNRCFMPLEEQCKSVCDPFCIGDVTAVSIESFHKGFHGTADDLTQLRVALLAAQLRKTWKAAAGVEVLGDSPAIERFLLEPEFQLAPHSNEEFPCGHAEAPHTGLVCFKFDSKDGPKSCHYCPQPVISLETRKKHDSPSYPSYYSQSKEAMFSISEGRPQDPESSEDLLDAAMKFELLSIPFKTHVKISSGPNRQALKDGVFVLYNCVRLANVTAKYQAQVESGNYLSIKDKTSFEPSILEREAEYDLLWEASLLPKIVWQSLGVATLPKGPDFRPHVLYNYLLDLSRKVSVFYRNFQILKDPVPQLLPEIQARGLLVSAVLAQLKNGLSLLDICPPSHM